VRTEEDLWSLLLISRDQSEEARRTGRYGSFFGFCGGVKCLDIAFTNSWRADVASLKLGDHVWNAVPLRAGDLRPQKRMSVLL
jgi:hypothetical protein